MSRAKCSTEPKPAESIDKSAADAWSDLDPDLKCRTIRLLSDLCYAYVTKQIEESAAGNQPKEDSVSITFSATD